MVRRVERSGGLRRPVRGVALDGRAVGVLDGAQPIRDPGLAGGDGLAVAPAVGAFGQAAAGPLDLADVGLAFVGVRGDGEHGDVGGGVVQDKADRLGLGVAAGQGEDPGTVGLGPGLLGVDAALADPVMELGEDHVGPVDLVADGGEVLPDRAQVGAAVDGVFQQPGGLRLVRVGAGAGVPAQLGLEVRVDRSGFDEADQAAGEVPDSWGRAASQMASRRAVRWSTMVPRRSASAMPSSMSRSYMGRSGSGPASGSR